VDTFQLLGGRQVQHQVASLYPQVRHPRLLVS
jgi:hypothetical protein